MIQFLSPHERGCPFLRPVAAATFRGARQVALYCRLPHGRVRIPTPDERARLCLDTQYDACLQYQRARLGGIMPDLD